ncbi:calcium-binding protein [Tychonema sp. LEGE 07203]|uniref:calcium-binding protein n=1 Tax=Tychonema sp. LEGE 07203 TaxID=1828671 RepID=UPI00187EBFA7|nr:calcium-binding protein [Tychonema sp. LEGE 07203]MBE9093127.1 pre-peptidase C-terminal domain-containing protein [Tychonema sp. LEGE 07203]
MIDPGNRMSTALNVGSLVGGVAFADSLNRETMDNVDFYRVTLDRSSRLNVSLFNSATVDVNIIRDFNNNDIVDSNEAVRKFTNFGNSDDSIDAELPAGTYFISVGLLNSSIGSRATDYSLTLTNTPVGTLTVDPGNQMSQSLDIGILNRSRTFSEYAGNSTLDPIDFYRFTLAQPTDVSLTLSGTTQSILVKLIQDRNNNNVVESNETIAGRSTSTRSISSEPVSVNQALQPGTYFVEISDGVGNRGSNYTLNFFTPGATAVPFGPDGTFFNLSNDSDTITIDPTKVGNLLVRGLDGDDVMQGSSSNDLVNGNAGSDILLGADGNDTLFGGRDADRIEGNAGDDLISGNLGNDTLYGGAGNDIVRGGQNDDLLFGGEGNDQLVGDRGKDTLTGDAGNDLFILRVNASGSSVADADIIADFTAGQDAIVLTNGLGFSGIALDASGSNTAIRIVTTGQILGVVSGVQPAALSAGNFTTLPGDF